jgi:hypothetical protein
MKSLTVAAALLGAAFVMGSAGPAAAQAQAAFCTMIYKPVCAERGKMQFTYANACFAQKDGAKVIHEGKCKPPKKAKPKKAKKKKK